MTAERAPIAPDAWKAEITRGAILGAVVVTPVLAGAGFESFVLAFFGSMLLFAVLVLGLPVVGVAAIASIITFVQRRPWARPARPLVLGGSAMFGTVFALGTGALVVAELAHNIAESRAMRLGRPIVLAIEAHERDVGHPPASLAELVPTYLESVPSTGDPDWEYAVAPLDVPIDARWELRATLRPNTFSYDYVVYWPDGVRPTEIDGFPVQARGDWSSYTWSYD